MAARFLWLIILGMGAALAGCSEPPSCVFEGDGRYYCWQDEDPDFCASGGGSYAEQTCADRGYTAECSQDEIGEFATQNEWTAADGCDRSIPPDGSGIANSSNGNGGTGLPEVEFTEGSFFDERDGQEYPTTTVAGTTWFAKNLNFEVEGTFDPIGQGSFSYDGDSTADEALGRFYTWEAAMVACPDGWRLSSEDDWQDLGRALGVEESLLSASSVPAWGGYLKESGSAYWDEPNEGASNVVGFSARGAGWGSGTVNMPTFKERGQLAIFWTSSEVDATRARTRTLNSFDDSMRTTGQSTDGNYLASVRCVQ